VLRERRLRALEAAAGDALLGREFLHLRALAERCAAETGVAFRISLGATALARLAAVCAQRSSHFGPLVAERPGFAAALAGTLRDLRDAGVAPGSLPNEVADLRALYTDVDRALVALEAGGAFDRIGLFRLAARGAAAWVARRGFERAEVHGATELVGSAGDLVDAVALALPAGALRFPSPISSDTPALARRRPGRASCPGRSSCRRRRWIATARFPKARCVCRAHAARGLERVPPRAPLLERAWRREILIVARSLELRRVASPIFGLRSSVTSSLARPAVAGRSARGSPVARSR
jgi:hypothetical protein